MVDRAIDEAHEAYAEREKELGADVLAQVERSVVLTVIDNKWREHLAEMDYLRAGIGLRAMGQRDPLTEYQREAYETFADLVDSVKSEALRYVFKAQITQPQTAPPPRIEPTKVAFGHVRSPPTRSAVTSPAPAEAARSTRCATAPPSIGAGAGTRVLSWF